MNVTQRFGPKQAADGSHPVRSTVRRPSGPWSTKRAPRLSSLDMILLVITKRAHIGHKFLFEPLAKLDSVFLCADISPSFTIVSSRSRSTCSLKFGPRF